mgnify:CR=1 FL=1
MPEIKETIAIFILHENNMRCLHWNCVGHDFMTAHGVAEEYTEHICSDIDKLAEFNDILGNSPNQVNLIEAAKIIEESDKKLFLVDPSKYYSADDVYKCMTIILSDLKSVIEELLDEIDGDDVAGIHSELETMHHYYHFQRDYLNKHRLITPDTQSE